MRHVLYDFMIVEFVLDSNSWQLWRVFFASNGQVELFRNDEEKTSSDSNLPSVLHSDQHDQAKLRVRERKYVAFSHCDEYSTVIYRRYR